MRVQTWALPICRLFVELLLQFRITVFGVVAIRIAGVVLIECDVRIVDPSAGEVHADRIVLLRHLRMPEAGLDDLEFAVDVDVRELIDQDHRRIAIDLDVSRRSEEHTSELQSLMRISYAVFCLKKKKITIT